VLVPFPYSDLRGSKRRPACVVSARPYNDQSPDVVLAMVTSNSARIQQPGRGDVAIRGWRTAGLRLPSVLRAGRLLVLEQRLLGPVLGDLTPGDLRGVDASLRLVLGL